MKQWKTVLLLLPTVIFALIGIGQLVGLITPYVGDLLGYLIGLVAFAHTFFVLLSAERSINKTGHVG